MEPDTPRSPNQKFCRPAMLNFCPAKVPFHYLFSKKSYSLWGVLKNRVFLMDFRGEMASWPFFRSFFRGFSSATPKRFEIISRDLLPNLSLDIAEAHEKKNPESDEARRRYAPSKFACRRFLPPLTLTSRHFSKQRL